MRNIHISDSYNIWDIDMMKTLILSSLEYFVDPEVYLNRSYSSMYIEWILHNIGYYVTLPFIKINFLKIINNRCKDIDLEEWK